MIDAPSSSGGSMLIPDTKIEVLLSAATASAAATGDSTTESTGVWLQAELLDIVATPRVDTAIESITKHAFHWQIGWPCAAPRPLPTSFTTPTQPAAGGDATAVGGNTTAANTNSNPNSNSNSNSWMSVLTNRDWTALSALAILYIRNEQHQQLFHRLRHQLPDLPLAPVPFFHVCLSGQHYNQILDRC
jgi:hypothetical protein